MGDFFRDVLYRNLTVLSPDPHRFDGDHDGVGELSPLAGRNCKRAPGSRAARQGW